VYLHAMLTKLNLFLQATMPGIARDEDDNTWRGISGEDVRRRGDFVALPLSWSQKTWTAGVEHEFNLAMKKEDHRATSAEVEFGSRGVAALAKRSGCRHCRAEYKREDGARKAFAEDLQKIPKLGWQVEPQSHPKLLNYRATQLLARWFPKPRKRPKQEWTPQEVVELLNDRGAQRKAVRANRTDDRNRQLARAMAV